MRATVRVLDISSAPMFNVVRNSLMPAAGVRANVRDSEPEMSSIIGWQSEAEKAAAKARSASGRKALSGAAVSDRWETEAHQQFQYYTIEDPTPVELSHTHQYDQPTRHLEQQQQLQIRQRTQALQTARGAPAIEDAQSEYSEYTESTALQSQQQQQQQQENVGEVVQSNASGGQAQPLRKSKKEIVVNAKRGGKKASGKSRRSASDKHIARMRAARTKANAKPPVYTEREMPDSTAARKLKRAPFHTYGRGNTHTVTKYVNFLRFTLLMCSLCVRHPSGKTTDQTKSAAALFFYSNSTLGTSLKETTSRRTT